MNTSLGRLTLDYTPANSNHGSRRDVLQLRFQTCTWGAVSEKVRRQGGTRGIARSAAALNEYGRRCSRWDGARSLSTAIKHLTPRFRDVALWRPPNNCIVVNTAGHAMIFGGGRIETHNSSLALQRDDIIWVLGIARRDDDDALDAFTNPNRLRHKTIEAFAADILGLAFDGIDVARPK